MEKIVDALIKSTYEYLSILEVMGFLPVDIAENIDIDSSSTVEFEATIYDIVKNSDL